MERNQISRMINEAIADLDLDLIVNFYRELDIPWLGEEEYSGRRKLKRKVPTKKQLESELRTICQFTIRGNLAEYSYQHWTIMWTNEEHSNFDDDFGSELEILFIPTRSITFQNMAKEESEEEELMSIVKMEIGNLKQQLREALDSEDYEKCTQLQKEIDKLNNPKNKKKSDK